MCCCFILERLCCCPGPIIVQGQRQAKLEARKKRLEELEVCEALFPNRLPPLAQLSSSSVSPCTPVFPL